MSSFLQFCPHSFGHVSNAYLSTTIANDYTRSCGGNQALYLRQRKKPGTHQEARLLQRTDETNGYCYFLAPCAGVGPVAAVLRCIHALNSSGTTVQSVLLPDPYRCPASPFRGSRRTPRWRGYCLPARPAARRLPQALPCGNRSSSSAWQRPWAGSCC